MSTQLQEKQQSFLEKVISNSGLQSDNDAQMATKIVFRILRDLMPREEVDRVAEELTTEAPRANMELADLWNDTNTMVAFFSRISPIQQLNINLDTFLRRLNEEAALPAEASPEAVTRAVFSALKDELPQQKIDEVAQYLPEDIRTLW